MTWYPKLRSDLLLVEQTYRGEQTYVVKDLKSFKYYRFKPLEVMVLQEFNGERTPAQVAATLAEQGIPLAEATVENFAKKIKRMGLLVRSLTEKSVLMMERLRAERRRRVKKTHYQGSLLRMRWSVGDPNQFFDAVIPRIKFLFTPTFVRLSIVAFAVYLAVLVLNWGMVTAYITTLYDPHTWTLNFIAGFWVITFILLIIHELAHGFVCKYFGGQVYEMGAMLMYFQPAFYCNVNDAWTFPELSKRMWVTAAGSWIELVLAGFAAVVWLMAEPGTVIWGAAALVFTMGGLMTLVANLNPLIPLDGYYALSDYLEIPNLRHRAFEYLSWMLKRHVLRLQIPEPAGDDREKRVFLIYGILAAVYIGGIFIFIGGLIFGWLTAGFGAVGVLLFMGLAWGALRSTAREWASATATSFREHRTALTSRPVRYWSAASITVILLIGLLVPWPIVVPGTFRTLPANVVALTSPETAAVVEILAREGSHVSSGTPLLILRSFGLERAVQQAGRTVDQLSARAAEARGLGRTAEEARLTFELASSRASLAALTDRERMLTVRAPFDGIVVTPRIEESLALQVEPGDTLLQVVNTDSLELRLALRGGGAALVAAGQRVRLVSHSDVATTIEATLASVSSANAPHGLEAAVEARVYLSPDEAPPLGGTGEARVNIRRSNLFGAIWWAIRTRMRGDLLL